VTPLLPLVAGVLLLVVAAAILRSYGPRYRVARLLSTVQPVSVEAAVQAVERGELSYLRVDGRIDSEETFEDAAQRPLVLRRTRLQARTRRGWQTFEETREQVPFEVGDGIRAIEIDGDALDSGLVVIPRESVGVVGDLAGRAPAELAPRTPARAVVEQISAVEHATVLGMAVPTADGRVRLTAGLGRPLVLTTLEVPEAMRVIAGDGRARPGLVAACGVTGLLLIALSGGWALVTAFAGSS
jgi:hypothetical protein